MRTVLCFGDSNSHGTLAMRFADERRRLPFAERWPQVMASALGGGWEVIAEGHPGRTSVFADPIEGPHKNGQAALPVLLETHRPLDLVIVMLGTNDLKARFAAHPIDIALGIERLLIEIGRSDAGPEGSPPSTLIVAPARIQETGVFAEVFAGGAEKSTLLPARLAQVAARQGAAFLDANDHVAVDPTDGIHLDAVGHAALGAAVARAICVHTKTWEGRDNAQGN